MNSICKSKTLIILCAALAFNCTNRQSAFKFVQNEQGIELLENNQRILFYQKAVKTIDGKFARNNYIHPLYTLSGDTLTEDFPDDSPSSHLHHRGIFWAWHQLYAGKQNLGDGWELEDFIIDIVALNAQAAAEHATINIKATWQSPNFQNKKPYIEENTAITVYPTTRNTRIIDFEIALLALVPEVRIGGSNDDKGYGGFSARIKMPDGLIFTGESGTVTPQRLQISAGSWMDFSAPYEKSGELSGLTILCHPSLPNFPQPWILRQKKSMQNPVFPGEKPISLSMDKPIILRYRLVLHKGDANVSEITKWQAEYAETTF